MNSNYNPDEHKFESLGEFLKYELDGTKIKDFILSAEIAERIA